MEEKEKVVNTEKPVIKPAGQVIRPAGKVVRPGNSVNTVKRAPVETGKANPVEPKTTENEEAKPMKLSDLGTVVKPAPSKAPSQSNVAKSPVGPIRPAEQDAVPQDKEFKPTIKATAQKSEEPRQTLANSSFGKPAHRAIDPSTLGKMSRIIKSHPVTFEKKQGKKDYVLYVIMDKPIEGVLQYFRSYGVNVSKIFTRIADARNALLMQVDPTKIVIVDSGNGAFNNMSARKDLIDLIGLGDGENKVIAFYSDTNLRAEVDSNRAVQKKAVEWVKYKTTSGVLAYLLQDQCNCNYITDGGYSEAGDIVVTLHQRLLPNKELRPNSTSNTMFTTSEIPTMTNTFKGKEDIMEKFTPIIR